MTRRGVPAGSVNWYFSEWMTYLGITKQTIVMERTGWSKATASQVMTGKQDYSPKIVNEAAEAFELAPYELLMRPEEAMALRRLRENALEVVENGRALSRNGTEG